MAPGIDAPDLKTRPLDGRPDRGGLTDMAGPGSRDRCFCPITPPRGQAPWQRFGFAVPGSYEIRVRATDRRGRVQPTGGRNSVHGITVLVAE